MKMKIRSIATLIFCQAMLICGLAHAEAKGEESGKAVAVVGTACSVDGALGNYTGSPLVCADGKWRNVILKSQDGMTNPAYYEAPCSLRIEDGQTKAFLNVKRGALADICVPKGRQFNIVAQENTLDWHLEGFSAFPNLMIIKPSVMASLRPTQLWIYARKDDGTLPEKIVVTLRATE